MVDKQKRKAMSMEIAQRLSDMRREKGFSQEELANQLGLSRQAISKWERGESAPDMANLIALADLYEVSLDELIRGQAPEATAHPAESDSSASAAPTEKVDVTVNTFINDEKPKASEPPASTSAAPTPTTTYPPPPQTMPVYQVVAPTPEPPKVTNEVWMTFPYPLFCALLYLVLGFVFGFWHPGWIIFLTIPFFYWIVRVVKQDPNYIASHTQGVPGAQCGQPTGEVNQP